MSLMELLRPEIRKLRAYRNAEFQEGMVRLNANENPWRPPGDPTVGGLNRYPEPRPFELIQLLARHYGVRAEQVLVTRGSSEAIDVVIRGFCRAGEDEIVICPPTFGMYEVYAQLQGAAVRSVPLLRDQGYAVNVEGIASAWNDRSRVLFICSPNNPTGNVIPTDIIAGLARTIQGKGVLVLDAAYGEFSSDDPTLPLLRDFDNVLVLRTLSKAMALAGVRCGVLLGPAPVVSALSCVLPPYCFPTVSVEAVTRCLATANATDYRQRVATLKSERDRLAVALRRLPGVVRVWPSEANFLLLEVRDAAQMVATAKAARVLVRDFSWDRWLPNCVRITVGDPAENDQLLRGLE